MERGSILLSFIKKMAELIKETWRDNLWLKILTVTSIIFIAIGIFCPPLGIVDNSVIISVGELAGFGALFQVSKAIDVGYDAKVKTKQIELEINSDKDKNDSDC